MEKYDLSECSIVIPLKIDSPERLEHIQFLVEYFARFFKNYELIIVEQGEKHQFIPHDLPGIKMILEKTEGLFSSARVCNSGAALVTHPFFCKIDADVCIHPKAIFDGFESLKNHPDQSFILPYNRVCFDIKGSLRKQILTSFDLNLLPFVKQAQVNDFSFPDLALRNSEGKGLIHLFRSSVFKELGGYNEKFVDWGYEDNEIIRRFEKLGHSVRMLEDYNAFHFEHPVLNRTFEREKINYFKYLSLEKMTPDQLRAYIKTWSRF